MDRAKRGVMIRSMVGSLAAVVGEKGGTKRCFVKGGVTGGVRGGVIWYIGCINHPKLTPTLTSLH